jgi:hypothetical protein
MNRKCHLLSLFKIHGPNCARCRALEKCGLEMRQRLEELKLADATVSVHREFHGELVEVFNSEVAASPLFRRLGE